MEYLVDIEGIKMYSQEELFANIKQYISHDWYDNVSVVEGVDNIFYKSKPNSDYKYFMPFILIDADLVKLLTTEQVIILLRHRLVYITATGLTYSNLHKNIYADNYLLNNKKEKVITRYDLLVLLNIISKYLSSRCSFKERIYNFFSFSIRKLSILLP